MEKVLDCGSTEARTIFMTTTKAPRAERIAAHRASMNRLGEILAARRAARVLEIKIDMAQKALRSLPKAEREASAASITKMCNELAALYRA
jgi:hypothetical protein